MSTDTPGNGTTLQAVVTPAAPQRLIVSDTSSISYLMDTARYQQAYTIAKRMAESSLIPLHLVCEKVNKDWKALPENVAIANCFLVFNQAMRWEVDPFALAAETYVVANKLGYQGKLIASVVHARSNLKGRLRQEYSGEGLLRTIKITGQFKDEDFTREIELSVKQAKTDNQMWDKDPDQKLWYSGVTKWARRHCPEVLLGIMTDDDVDTVTHATPRALMGAIESGDPQHATKGDALVARLEAQKTTKPTEPVKPVAEELSQGTIRTRLIARIDVATAPEQITKVLADAQEMLKASDDIDIVDAAAKSRQKQLDELAKTGKKTDGKLPGT